MPALGDRALGAILGLPSSVVLGIAAWLTPSPAGFGTHKQLGLGTCTILGLTGWPCPMCGMTTTFAHMAHLHPLQAVTTQPFGVVLFLLTAASAGVGVLEMLSPRGRLRKIWGWLEPREGMVAGLLLAGLALGWLYKVWAMGPQAP